MNKRKLFTALVSVVLAIGLVYFWKIQSSNVSSSQEPISPVVAVPSQEDECNLDPKTLQGAIDIKSEEIASVEKDALSLENRSYHQIVVLKDGKKIEYSEGGCAHFGYKFILHGYKASPNKMDWIESGMNLLSLPIYNQHGDENSATLIESFSNPDLSEEGPEESVGLPCGDASCELSISDGNLTVGYDFAL